jgi:N-acetylglucosamine kinase-like BadF-type ATPase
VDCVLGVDVGGSSTRCAVASSAGRCLGYAKGGGGNPISVGAHAAIETVAGGIGLALERAKIGGERIVAVVFCMAGGLTSEDTAAFGDTLRELGIRAAPTPAGDLFGNFCSGTWQTSGYLLESGTGAGALRIEDGEVAKTSDGLGWLLGDEGSGFWIGRRVVRAALADLDDRGPRTRLTELVLGRLGLAREGQPDCGRDLVDGRPAVVIPALRMIYKWRPVELAGFAAEAFAAGDDAVAAAIREEAALSLDNTLAAVSRPGIRGPVVIAGSVLLNNPGLLDRVKGLAARHLPQAAFIPVPDGVAGAVTLALRQIGVQVGRAQFEAITDSLAALPNR